MGKQKGSVRLRKDGRWEGRYVVGYKQDGRPIQKNVLAKTKSECQAKLQKRLDELPDAQRKTASPDMALGAWMDLWYQSRRKIGLRPTTAAAYDNHIYKHIIPALGTIPLNRLTKDDLQSFFARLKEDGRLTRRKIYGGGLSDRTVRACHACLSTAREDAAAEKLIRRNPAHECRLPPKKGREMQILSRDEMQKLLYEAEREGFYELFLLELATGLRRGELLALRWEDVDLDTGEVRISRQIHAAGGKLTESAPKTAKACRTLLLPPPLCAVLRQYKETVSSRWLFPSPVQNDAPREPSAVRKALTRILSRAGCKRVRFHDLRHTFATHALEYGMDVKTLAATIGHASAETTLNVYAHVTEEIKANAAQAIDRTLGNGTDSNGDEKPAAAEPVRFEPYKGKIRRRGTGCISRISDTTWEGRYSPRLPDGKRDQHVVYAHSEEECERLLAEMILDVKTSRASQNLGR